MKMMRHLILGLMLFAPGMPVWADGLALASNLQHDGVESERGDMPIMVFYMSTSCPYCDEVKDLYLNPMVQSGQYDGRLIIRMVDTEGGDSLRDFHGKRMDHEQFADSEGASLTPVLKFYDHTGAELVPEVLGYTSPDFYLAYLENAIETSISKPRPVTKTAKASF